MVGRKDVLKKHKLSTLRAVAETDEVHDSPDHIRPSRHPGGWSTMGANWRGPTAPQSTETVGGGSCACARALSSAVAARMAENGGRGARGRLHGSRACGYFRSLSARLAARAAHVHACMMRSRRYGDNWHCMRLLHGPCMSACQPSSGVGRCRPDLRGRHCLHKLRFLDLL